MVDDGSTGKQKFRMRFKPGALADGAKRDTNSATCTEAFWECRQVNCRKTECEPKNRRIEMRENFLKR